MQGMTEPGNKPTMARSALLIGFAMAAFAANSVLCRMALGGNLIDAASFTSLRMVSGALCLSAIILARDPSWRPSAPSWPSVFMLFLYMACFSFAYRALSAGTGALILFGFVQLTMIGAAFFRGDRLSTVAWAGLALAFGGLVYLMLPSIRSPEPLYALLMALSGISWGFYSLFGKKAGNPTISTASNFIYAVPLVLLASALQIDDFSISASGFSLAILSGAVTSGLGYAVWYEVLKDIKSTQAATVQLSVPALATLGGVVLLSEPLNQRILIAIMMTIGGIAIVLNQSAQQARKRAMK